MAEATYPIIPADVKVSEMLVCADILEAHIEQVGDGPSGELQAMVKAFRGVKPLPQKDENG